MLLSSRQPTFQGSSHGQQQMWDRAIAPGRTRLSDKAVHILGIDNFGRGVVTGVGLLDRGKKGGGRSGSRVQVGSKKPRSPDVYDSPDWLGCVPATRNLNRTTIQNDVPADLSLARPQFLSEVAFKLPTRDSITPRDTSFFFLWPFSFSFFRSLFFPATLDLAAGNRSNASNKGKGKAPAKKRQLFNHKRTHLLKLERENKTPDTRRAPKNRGGALKEVTLKKTPQRNGASKSCQRLPSSSDNDEPPPGSPSTPDRGHASQWGGLVLALALPPVLVPALHPPTKQSPLQGGAGSNCEHGARNEAEGAPIPGSRQNSPESSPRRNAREEDKDAPVAPRRSSRQARVGLAAAALEAADGAAEDNDDARKGSGGSKKGGKENATPKPKPKPKPKKGKDEELFPDEGEEDGDN
ncbi:hypothetical protein BDV93DRAFT_511073 [Ceratobasidium sp. AG-I]|nr:hypothetical protein BDV93DRAFT_511073 [Ceratobasidium sp. AG-I]